MGSLTTFKDYLKGALGGSEVKKTITGTFGSVPISKIPENAAPQFSSFGIGIGLTFLGQYILTKKRGSPAARAIAKILGADVNASNRDFALAKLRDPGSLVTIQENILDVLKTKSIDDFAKTLELSPDEAWEVYRQIKDMIVDSEIIEMLTGVSNKISSIKATFASEVQSLRITIDKQMKTVTEELKDYSAKLEMSKLGLELVITPTLAMMSDGNTDCWKEGRFTIEDVKNGYDVRRSKTDEIINSIDKNVGTILFGESYSGKSTILDRVILEEVLENGYAVVHGEGMKAEASLLRVLLENITNRFTRVLVIADNVHKRGSEELFKVFNKYYNVKNDTDNRIRFLFAARKTEFDISKNTLEPNDKKEINHSLSHIEEIRLSFEEQDAILFLKKALSVSKREKIISEEEIEREAKKRYEFSEHDLFMFIYAVQEYIGGDKIYVHFFEDDMEQKINSISENIVLERPSLLCSFMGMCGIELSNELMDNCGVYFDVRNLLVKKGFLFQNGKYRVRHERWSKEFLCYLYKIYFSNNFKPFDDKYKIREILQSILNNVNVEDLFNIINVCSSVFQEKEGRLKPLGEVVIQNFTVPDHLNVNDKADLYCYGLGTFYHLLGDYKKALDSCYKATNENPGHADAWVNKGNSLASLGRYEEAIISYDKATKIKPDHASAWNNKGLSLDGLQRYEEAIASYDKATKIKPDHADAWYNKGVALANLGRYEEAIISYDKATKIKPGHTDAWYNKGNSLDNLGRYEEAIISYDKAIKINPNDAETWNNRGAALGSLGRHEESIASYDKATKIKPGHADAWNNKGNSLNNLGRYEEAIISFEEATKIKPDHASAWYNKGNSLNNLGRHEEAIISFEEAIELNPNDADAWYNRGAALANLGRYEEAIISYDKATKIKPDHASAWYNKGNSLANLGRHEEAIISYDKATKIKPGHADAWNNKGNSLNNLGRYEEAIISFEEATKINPNDAYAWNNRGAALGSLGRHEEAIISFEEAIELNPNYASAWNNKGLSLDGLQRYEEAIASYDKATKINPNDAETWNHKGSVLDKVGRRDEAQNCFDKAKELGLNI